jgi:hypothetical protein
MGSESIRPRAAGLAECLRRHSEEGICLDRAEVIERFGIGLHQ